MCVGVKHLMSKAISAVRNNLNIYFLLSFIIQVAASIAANSSIIGRGLFKSSMPKNAVSIE